MIDSNDRVPMTDGSEMERREVGGWANERLDDQDEREADWRRLKSYRRLVRLAAGPAANQRNPRPPLRSIVRYLSPVSFFLSPIASTRIEPNSLETHLTPVKTQFNPGKPSKTQ